MGWPFTIGILLGIIAGILAHKAYQHYETRKMVLFKKKRTKRELLEHIEQHIQKDKERLIDALIILEEHYEIPSIKELEEKSLEELRKLHGAYLTALQEDVGE